MTSFLSQYKRRILDFSTYPNLDSLSFLDRAMLAYSQRFIKRVREGYASKGRRGGEAEKERKRGRSEDRKRVEGNGETERGREMSERERSQDIGIEKERRR